MGCEVMKKIWVVEYNSGKADVFDVEHPAPALPYVCAFDAEERIKELEEALEGMHTQECLDYSVKTAMRGSGYHCISKCANYKKSLKESDGE
jgi:hypothetical protein